MNKLFALAGLGVLSVAMAASACKGKEAPTEASNPGEQEAVAAADAWLLLVDGEKYQESWEQAAGIFKAAVTADSWKQQVAAVRKPLGKLVSRKLKSKTFATSLPGAPDGKYVVIQYDATYESKAAAVETVTPAADKDGKWRVSGYFIR